MKVISVLQEDACYITVKWMINMDFMLNLFTTMNALIHPSIHLQSNRRFPSLPLTSHPLQHFCGNAEVFVNHLRDTISLAPSLPHSWIRQWYSWFPQLWSQTHSKTFWGNVGSRHSESQELCCLGQYAPCRVSQVKLALDWPGGGLDVSILSGSDPFLGCGTVKNIVCLKWFRALSWQ